MLKLKYLFENYELAKLALQNWAFDKDSLSDMLAQYRISSNAIYPYMNHGRVCFLRLAPTEEKLPQNVAGEMEFIAYLRAHDYPALAPIPTLRGETWRVLSTPWGEYYASAFERVPGESLENTALTPEIAREYGAALGRLHALSANYEPHTRKWTHEDALLWIERALAKGRAPEKATRELARVRAALAELPRTKQNYGLTHYDFEPDNVFYDARTGLISAIDFDDGMYHFFALDLEQTLDAMEECVLSDACTLSEAREAFTRGYHREFPGSENEEASRPLMRRFINLFSYARLLYATRETFDDEPDWLLALREKLSRMMQNDLAQMGREA